jgi:ferric-dicitrate binding protein FerR (iron transport regulator)
VGLVKEVDISRVLSWQSGQLYFLEDDLSTVFEDVMRYSDISFRLTDQAIGERIYTGSFRPDSLEAWLDAMERAYSLKVTRIGSDWIAITPTD